jgi:hypothetical protein
MHSKKNLEIGVISGVFADGIIFPLSEPKSLLSA